ncbi:glycosyltransferase [Actinoplanes sp. NPDC049316]|uniref:glycosyltransferase n=1 Tax=Actinoplanes sp. NPDC049316 TaxID=3154727 RepID=UPI00342E7304
MARTIGVRRLDTPYVAFCDDDTWWEPGSLRVAAELLDAYPRIGVRPRSRCWMPYADCRGW